MLIDICNFEIKINKAGGTFPCNLILNFEELCFYLLFHKSEIVNKNIIDLFFKYSTKLFFTKVNCC